MNTDTIDPFYKAFRGAFTSCLKWTDLDNFWKVLKKQANKGWFIYTIGEAVPTTPVSADALCNFINELDTRLHQDHKEDYCGIVYIDDKQQPTYIKIYDPDNLGMVCGFSDNPPLPGWIISTCQPKPLEDFVSDRATTKRWWQKLFGW